MPSPPEHRDPNRAVRRAAIRAFSRTELASLSVERMAQAAADPQPSNPDYVQVLEACSLAEAYATLTGMSYEEALDRIVRDAKVLYEARLAAAAEWLRTCHALGGDSQGVRAVYETDQAPTAAMTAYAVAADIPYPQACRDIYVDHAVICPDHTRGPSLGEDTT